jgi:hypothetical protein
MPPVCFLKIMANLFPTKHRTVSQEDVRSQFYRNVGKLLPEYIASQLRRRLTSISIVPES